MTVSVEEASRGEKKARKAMEKMGLKQMPHVTRVVISRPRNQLFVIATPDVYKGVGETYVVFGQAKTQDLDEPQQYSAPVPQQAPAVPEEDEDGIEGKDIELVMQQAGVTREKAVEAIKSNNNDIVNAIMELTM